MKGGSGATRNRTGDTRIFSPLLYQLSYGTLCLICDCKGSAFLPNSQIFWQKIIHFTKKTCTFALHLRKTADIFLGKVFHRDVAQLVAHYVRDVGVGRSSRLIPTCTKRLQQQPLFFVLSHLIYNRRQNIYNRWQYIYNRWQKKLPDMYGGGCPARQKENRSDRMTSATEIDKSV